jgi:glycosyltransferase involved in cell wall biosynthesis/GT2 family glycosyltransferase
MTARLRVLFLTLGSPLSPDRGPQIRDHELIMRVAARHEVTVLPVLEPGQALGSDPKLGDRCEVLAPAIIDGSAAPSARRAVRHLWRGRPLASLPYIDGALVARLASIAGSGRFDLVQLEHSFLAPCADVLPGSCRKVLSLHNIGHCQYLSIARATCSPSTRAILRAKAHFIRSLERAYIPRFDGVVVVSEADRQRLAQLGPAPPVAVVRNGVDLERLQPIAGDGIPGMLLFVGNLAYAPNADAVVEFCRTMLPALRERIPGVRLLVVGDRPPPRVLELADGSVEIVGCVEDLRPWYERSQAAVVPLRAGGGTRLKVLEAMALGRCVISTPAGAEGIELAHGDEALIAEPGSEFVDQVEDALSDPALRDRVTRRARAFVEREHGWEAAAASLLELYERLRPAGRQTRPPVRRRPGDAIRTSVVIPAYQASSTLPLVLDALASQLGPQREVIVVQSAIEDHTVDSVERRPWLRVVSAPERLWPGQARNLGAAKAQGQLLAFLDADSVPSPDWLDRLEHALRPELEAVAGGIVNGTPHSLIGTAEYVLSCSEAFPRRGRPIRHGPGANLLVRRGYFDAIGGFLDRRRAGEDTLLTFPLARQQRLGFAADARVAHVNRTKLGTFLANQRLQGRSWAKFCREVDYPHGWVTRGAGLLFAGPLRLVALGRCLLYNPPEARAALAALPLLLLGTAAWLVGLSEEALRRRQ